MLALLEDRHGVVVINGAHPATICDAGFDFVVSLLKEGIAPSSCADVLTRSCSVHLRRDESLSSNRGQV